MIAINSKTRIMGLLGYPLGHSYSPVMQNAAFEKMGMNKIYIPLEVTSENLGVVISGICKMNFDGFNVTTPHKIHVIDYIHEVDELSKVIGAVNVVTIKDGYLKGYNTDGMGFIRSFEEQTKMKFQGKNVFVIGSGGASRAICMAVAMEGANRIYVCNRTDEKAQALCSDINSRIRSCSFQIPMNRDAMKEALDDSEIIINTTSVGMYPNVDCMPIDKSLLQGKFVVCDAVYNPVKTKLLQEAEKLGCTTVDGLAMLVYQGAESFKLWTGVEPPIDAMFDAVKKASLL